MCKVSWCMKGENMFLQFFSRFFLLLIFSPWSFKLCPSKPDFTWEVLWPLVDLLFVLWNGGGRQDEGGFSPTCVVREDGVEMGAEIGLEPLRAAKGSCNDILDECTALTPGDSVLTLQLKQRHLFKLIFWRKFYFFLGYLKELVEV